MYCMNCGKEVPDGARFCAFCGQPCEVVHQPQGSAHAPTTADMTKEQQAEATRNAKIQAAKDLVSRFNKKFSTLKRVFAITFFSIGAFVLFFFLLGGIIAGGLSDVETGPKVIIWIFSLGTMLPLIIMRLRMDAFLKKEGFTLSGYRKLKQKLKRPLPPQPVVRQTPATQSADFRIDRPAASTSAPAVKAAEVKPKDDDDDDKEIGYMYLYKTKLKDYGSPFGTAVVAFLVALVVVFMILQNLLKAEFGTSLITGVVIGLIAAPIAASVVNNKKKAAMKKAGIDQNELKRISKDYKKLPTDYWKQAPVKNVVENKYGWRTLTPQQIKKQRTWAIVGLLSVLAIGGIALTATFGGGGSLEGRWEGQVINYQYSAGDVALEQIDSVAIVFQDGKAYFGSSMNNNADIIAECKYWNTGIATYKINGNTITFTIKGQAQTFDYKNGIIYMDDYLVKRVD